MSQIAQDAKATPNRIEEIVNGGERVTHLYLNDCYYAHLSIYHFGLSFCQDGMVLDAGSGAGYGSAYLAEHGARRVLGIDVSEKAVRFSQAHFQRPNLEYRVKDVQELSTLEAEAFDLIISSNTLEHVADVRRLFRAASRMLRPGCHLIVAVPPITWTEEWEENLKNFYHLNIWTPRQWYRVLRQYFGEVQCYWHGFEKEGVRLDFVNTPEETVIDETDFIFKPVGIDHFYSQPSLTVILVSGEPRPEAELPPEDEEPEYIENSITRPLASAGLDEDAERSYQKGLGDLLGQARIMVIKEGILITMKKAMAYVWKRLMEKPGKEEST